VLPDRVAGPRQTTCGVLSEWVVQSAETRVTCGISAPQDFPLLDNGRGQYRFRRGVRVVPPSSTEVRVINQEWGLSSQSPSLSCPLWTAGVSASREPPSSSGAGFEELACLDCVARQTAAARACFKEALIRLTSGPGKGNERVSAACPPVLRQERSEHRLAVAKVAVGGLVTDTPGSPAVNWNPASLELLVDKAGGKG